MCREMEDLEKDLEKSVWEIIVDLQREIRELEEENKKLKEEIKDHKLYEEKLEHRIIEFEELLHWE